METLSRLPWAAQSAVFKKLESIADVGAMSRDERLKYDEALRKYRDTINVFEGVRMDGLMEGRMEGRKEGRKEGRMEGRMEGQRSEKMENARKMKTYGLALDMIAEITGLSIEEVRGL